MKKITILRSLSIIITTLLIFPLFYSEFQATFRGLENKSSIKSFKNDIKISKVWDLTNTPIFIDDKDPSKNWSSTASNDWCNGSGTFNEPFVIENVIIDGNNTAPCIEIINSKVYFVIKNCTLYNSSGKNGIRLQNTANGTIEKNFFGNNYKAIKLYEYCYNNTITGNEIENQGIGIELNLSQNNKIYGNIISVNSVGIQLEKSGINNISNNIINPGSEYGIVLWDTCTYNNITGNDIKGNEGIGIRLYGLCSWNTISENKIINGSGYGIYMHGASKFNWVKFNTINDNGMNGITIGSNSNSQRIIGNTIKDNKEIGLFIYTDRAFNLMYNNFFIGNKINAIDNGTTNEWDNGVVGNYWDDYKGNDTNDDGIGDTPYYISGTAGSQDNFPIWDDGPDEIPDDNGDNGDEDGDGGVISGFDLVVIVPLALFVLSIAAIFKKKNFIK